MATNQPEILLKADSDINSCHELDILFYMMAIQPPFFIFKYVYCSFEHWVYGQPRQSLLFERPMFILGDMAVISDYAQYLWQY